MLNPSKHTKSGAASALVHYRRLRDRKFLTSIKCNITFSADFQSQKACYLCKSGKKLWFMVRVSKVRIRVGTELG